MGQICDKQAIGVNQRPIDGGAYVRFIDPLSAITN